MFCWQIEEVFEVCQVALEIVSCGYQYVEGDDFFGTEIVEPEHVALLTQLNDEIELIEIDETYDHWRGRFASELPETILRTWYDYEEGKCSDRKPIIRVHKNVYLPEERRGSWASVGFHEPCPACEDATRNEMTRYIKQFLSDFGIPCGNPDKTYWWYWGGKGSPRIIDCRADAPAPWVSSG